MAVTVDELLIKIELSNQKTAKELGNISKEIETLQKSSEKTSASVGDFSASFAKFSVVAMGAARGVEILIGTISEFTGEFFNAQDAMTKLNQSLELSGTKNIPDVIKQYESLGVELENFGVASVESVFKLAKIGTAAGQTTAQIKTMIRTAADLSVIKEIPLEQAFKALSSTLKGSSGAIATIFPELKNFTEEQLKAGKAIDYISAKVEGYAARNLETYAGKFALLKTKVGDTAEIIGEIIARSLTLDKSTLKLIQTIERFNNWLSGLKEIIISLVQTGISFLIDAFDNLRANLSLVDSAFGYTFGNIILYFGKLQKYTDELAGRNEKWGESQIKLGEAMLKSAAESKQFYTDWISGTKKAEDAIYKTADAFGDLADKANQGKKDIADMMSGMMTQEQLKAIEELKNKFNEYKKAVLLSNASGVVSAELQAQASKAEIDAIKLRISANGKLYGENKQNYQDILKYINQLKETDVFKIHSEQIDKYSKQYENLQEDINKSNMSQRQYADYQLEQALKKLEIDRQSAAFQSGEAKDLLDNAEKAMKLEAEARKNAMPMEFGDYIKKISESLKAIKMPSFTGEGLSNFGNQLSDIGSSFGSALVAGFSAVFNMVGMVIDTILNAPAILKYAFLELPTLLLQALTELPQILDQIIAEFPSLIAKLAESLPYLLSSIAAKIPDLIFMLLEQLPILIEKIAEAIPSIIMTIIKNIPKMIGAILKAVLASIVGFIKGIFKGLAGVFGGSLPDLPQIEVDEKQVKKTVEKITGAMSKIFKVEDFVSGIKKTSIAPIVKSTQPSKKDGEKSQTERLLSGLGKSVELLFKSIGKGLTNAIEGLFKIVNFIFFNIEEGIKKVFKGIEKAWKGVWAIVSGFTEALKPFINKIGDFKKIPEWVKRIFIIPEWIKKLKLETPEWIKNLKLETPEWIKNLKLETPEWLKNLKLEMPEWLKKLKLETPEWLKNLKLETPEWLKNLKLETPEFLKDLKLETPEWLDKLKIETPEWLDKLKIETPEWLDKLKIEIKMPEVKGVGGEDFWGRLKIPELKIPSSFSSGGLVYAQNGMFIPKGTDTVPAMLTPGEFVVSRRGVEANGIGMLQAINRGQTPSSNDIYNVAIEIKIDAKTTMDDSYIRGTLVPRMQEELKRASLDGKFVLSSRGIR